MGAPGRRVVPWRGPAFPSPARPLLLYCCPEGFRTTMATLIIDAIPPWPHHLDYGVLALVAALFLASVLAHRYWRAQIRLEDQLEAQGRDAERAHARYVEAFRHTPAPVAFVDRVTGLVMEAAPGWLAAGLPAAGEPVFRDDPDLETAWRAIAPPDAEHRAAAPVSLRIRGRAFRAEPLGGPSLGVVLVLAEA